MQLAALGLFVFQLATLPFSELRRRQEWRHARVQRVGARDAAQFVGPGEDTVSIGGVLLPEAAGSYAAIDTLREMAAQGERYPFVDGTGRVWGSFVITGLDEGRTHLLNNGVPRKVDFTLDLLMVDDG